MQIIWGETVLQRGRSVRYYVIVHRATFLPIFLVFPNAVNMLLSASFYTWEEKEKKKRRRCMSSVFFSILYYYYYCYYFSRPSLTACSTMFAIERKYTSPTKAPWKSCWRDGTIDSHTYIHTVSQGLFDSHGNFFFFSYFVGRSPVMSFIMQKHKPRIFFFEDKEKKRENPRWTYLLDIFSFFEQKKGEKGTWEDTSER